MTWYEQMHLATLANAIACTAICFICICRLNQINKSPWLRMAYTSLLAGAFVSGYQSILFGSIPTQANFIFSLSALLGLWLMIPLWKGQRNAGN